ncbi:hypothetical protein T265_03674 [Opisthorchis viverrini]|uniref:Uncharacterized protein n=1 Tax=Opisthorchis viverrini TaxID=6198 RepID=A0A075AHE9_OPIVI|nr:hypothetical protein T265_03674 [Opisthorchis viverrini]KER29764.1 hypothetical protein T265_03674 [Opisthorchis viverrini]
MSENSLHGPSEMIPKSPELARSGIPTARRANHNLFITSEKSSVSILDRCD